MKTVFVSTVVCVSILAILWVGVTLFTALKHM